MSRTVRIGDVLAGGGNPLLLIAGPCVIESREVVEKTAAAMKEITRRLGIGFVFKASYDKANRTSLTSFRGPGIDDGLEILQDIRTRFEVPVISDVHSPEEVKKAAPILDCLQIPAFLCRQTDLLIAAGQSGKPVNIKKGQFMAPEDMENAAKKAEESGAPGVMLTERGTTFGYHYLVVDFQGMKKMGETGRPIVFDATHSVQTPGGAGSASGGDRRYAPALARAAVAVGVDALFIEVHPDPANALCDGPNSLALDEVEAILKPIVEIHRIARNIG